MRKILPLKMDLPDEIWIMILSRLTPTELLDLKGTSVQLDNILGDRIFWRDYLKDYQAEDVAWLCYQGIIPCPPDDYWLEALDSLTKYKYVDIDTPMSDYDPNYTHFKADEIFHTLDPYHKYLYYINQIVLIIEAVDLDYSLDYRFAYYLVTPSGYVITEFRGNIGIDILEPVGETDDDRYLNYIRKIEKRLLEPRFSLYRGIETLIARNIVTYNDSTLWYAVTGLTPDQAIKFLKLIYNTKGIMTDEDLAMIIKEFNNIRDDFINA